MKAPSAPIGARCRPSLQGRACGLLHLPASPGLYSIREVAKVIEPGAKKTADPIDVDLGVLVDQEVAEPG